jgi:hypothetical protein
LQAPRSSPAIKPRGDHRPQLQGPVQRLRPAEKTTVDDIFDMYAAVLLNGFVPDTMLVHPMAWLMWVKDPILREFACDDLAGGGSFFANFTGNPAIRPGPSLRPPKEPLARARRSPTPAPPAPALIHCDFLARASTA